MPLSDDQLTEALRLREVRWTYDQIAARLGVSFSMVRRALSPGAAEREREGSRAWKRRNRELVARRDRERRIAARVPCPDCGGPMQRRSILCASCRRRAADERRDAVIRMWHEGRTVAEIAGALRTTPGTISVEVAKLRARGYDLPHRQRAAA